MWAAAVPYVVWQPQVISVPASTLVPLAYAVFVSSALSYGLITYASRELSATVVTSFWPLQVLAATALSSYCFGEVLGAQQAQGGVLIVLGMLVITYVNLRAGKDKASADKERLPGWIAPAYAQLSEEPA